MLSGYQAGILSEERMDYVIGFLLVLIIGVTIMSGKRKKLAPQAGRDQYQSTKAGDILLGLHDQNAARFQLGMPRSIKIV
jgi:hypothetical protein